jgi:hypothetical protein
MFGRENFDMRNGVLVCVLWYPIAVDDDRSGAAVCAIAMTDLRLAYYHTKTIAKRPTEELILQRGIEMSEIYNTQSMVRVPSASVAQAALMPD